MENANPVPGVVPHAPSRNKWQLGFKTQMMLKDIGLSIDATKEVGAATIEGCIDKDGSSVWLYVKDA